MTVFSTNTQAERFLRHIVPKPFFTEALQPLGKNYTMAALARMSKKTAEQVRDTMFLLRESMIRDSNSVNLIGTCQMTGLSQMALMDMIGGAIEPTGKIMFQQTFLNKGNGYVARRTIGGYVLTDNGARLLDGLVGLMRREGEIFLPKDVWRNLVRRISIEDGAELHGKEQIVPVPIVNVDDVFARLNIVRTRKGLRSDAPLLSRVSLDIDLAREVSHFARTKEASGRLVIELGKTKNLNPVMNRVRMVEVHDKLAADFESELLDEDLLTLGKLLTMGPREEFYELDVSFLRGHVQADRALTKVGRLTAAIPRKTLKERLIEQTGGVAASGSSGGLEVQQEVTVTGAAQGATRVNFSTPAGRQRPIQAYRLGALSGRSGGRGFAGSRALRDSAKTTESFPASLLAPGTVGDFLSAQSQSMYMASGGYAGVNVNKSVAEKRGLLDYRQRGAGAIEAETQLDRKDPFVVDPELSGETTVLAHEAIAKQKASEALQLESEGSRNYCPVTMKPLFGQVAVSSEGTHYNLEGARGPEGIVFKDNDPISGQPTEWKVKEMPITVESAKAELVHYGVLGGDELDIDNVLQRPDMRQLTLLAYLEETEPVLAARLLSYEGLEDEWRAFEEKEAKATMTTARGKTEEAPSDLSDIDDDEGEGTLKSETTDPGRVEDSRLDNSLTEDKLETEDSEMHSIDAYN